MGKTNNKLVVFSSLFFLPALIVAGFFIFGQPARAEADWQNTLEYYDFNALSNATWLDGGLNGFDVAGTVDGNIDQGRFGQASRYYPNQQYTSGYSGPQYIHAQANDGYMSASFWYKLNENLADNACWNGQGSNCGPTYKTVWGQNWCTNSTDWTEIHLGKINNEVGYAGDFVVQFLYNIPNSTDQFWFTSGELPRDQAWHNIVIVWKNNDPSAVGNGIWVDGVKDEAAKSMNPFSYPRNTQDTSGGCYTYLGPYNIFDISIDDLAIVKSDIAPQQISQLQTESYGEVLGEKPNGDKKEIVVPVILAETKDIGHNSNPITDQPCKLLPKKTYQYGHDKEYYQDLFYCVKAYHCENSFGKFNQQTGECENGLVDFKFEIYDNGGAWYKTDRNQSEYNDYKPRGNNDKPYSFKEEALLKAKEKESVLVSNNYDRYIIVGSGKYFYTSTNPEDRSIIASEGERTYGFAHELSHHLGLIFLIGEEKTMIPDLYYMGNTMGWDIMSSGDEKTADNPMFLSSYTKEFLKWFRYETHDKADLGDHWIKYLEEGKQNDPVFKYDLGAACQADAQKYYLLEARNKTLSTWDSSMPSADDQNLVLYYVDEKGAKEYGYGLKDGEIISILNTSRLVTIPGSPNSHNQACSGNDFKNRYGVLNLSCNPTFWDFNNLIKITAVSEEKKDGQGGINASISEISKNSVTETVYGAVSKDESAINLSDFYGGNLLAQNQITTYPDTDLHLYCDDGRHVGMNYETGKYEIGIEGAITIGDSQGAPEWIFVPAALKDHCHFAVSSRDTEKFIVENPELAAQIGLGDIKNDYEIYAREIDPIAGITTSAAVAGAINPGEIVEHKIADIGRLEISAGAPFDQTPPEILILTPQKINRNESLTVESLVSDAGAGIASGTIKTYFDGRLIINQRIDLFWEKLGEHEIKVTANDNNGNHAEATAKIEVVTDIAGTIADIERGFQEKLLNLKARNGLIGDLEDIQKYINKYGKREERRSEREQRLLAQCAVKKGQAWCETKLGEAFSRVNYRLSEINVKIIKIRYDLVLKKLDIYLLFGWVDRTGYQVIKEDLKYLMSNS